jgi:polyisoprenoid-binding protein YceI
MLVLLGITCLLFGFGSFIPKVKWHPEIFGVLNIFLLSVAVFGVMSVQAELPINMIYFHLALILAAFLVVPLSKTKPIFLKSISGLLALSPYLLFNQSFDFLGFKVLFNANGVVFLPVLAWVMITVADFLLPRIIKRYFCNQEHEIESIVFASIIAIGSFIGFFYGQSFGVFLVGIGALLAVQGGKARDFSFSFTLLGALMILASLSSILTLIENPDFTIYFSGQMMMAFFGAIVLLLTYHHVEKITWLSGLIFLKIVGFFVVLITFGGLMKEDIGGPLYLVFLLIFSLPIVIVWQIGKERQYLPLLLIIFGSALLLLPFFRIIPEELANINSNELSLVVKKKTTVRVPYETLPKIDFQLTLNKINTFDSDSSFIDFELGVIPSITKGSFKKWTGSITKTSDNTIKLEVALPLTGMTTRSSDRDASLMGVGYFNKAKTPIIRYNAILTQDENGNYIGTGKLKMGTGSASVNVKLKATKQTTLFTVLQGELIVDRTKFGMLSDPKIGDLVRVYVTAYLQKK